MLSPSCSPKHRTFMSVRLNLDCQPEGIKSVYENKCLRMSEREIRLMEVGRPALHLSGTTPWAGELNEQKGESELSPSIHYSLLPDCGGHVTSCLLLFRPRLPHDGLDPCGTVSPQTTKKQTKSFLKRPLSGHCHQKSADSWGVSKVVPKHTQNHGRQRIHLNLLLYTLPFLVCLQVSNENPPQAIAQGQKDSVAMYPQDAGAN